MVGHGVNGEGEALTRTRNRFVLNCARAEELIRLGACYAIRQLRTHVQKKQKAHTKNQGKANELKDLRTQKTQTETQVEKSLPVARDKEVCPGSTKSWGVRDGFWGVREREKTSGVVALCRARHRPLSEHGEREGKREEEMDEIVCPGCSREHVRLVRLQGRRIGLHDHVSAPCLERPSQTGDTV